jgi:hypothetical protein
VSAYQLGRRLRGLWRGIATAAGFIVCLLYFAPAPSAEDRALIIGINKYAHLPEKLQLTASVNDAQAMVQLAKAVWGFRDEQIKLLLDESATAGHILAAMDSWLVQGTQAGDRVVFAFSGHGYFTIEASTEDYFRRPALVPTDVEVNGSEVRNLIVRKQLRGLVDRLVGRDVMMVVDSCFSGTITRALITEVERSPIIVRSLAVGGRFRGVSKGAFDALRREPSFLEPRNHLMVWTAVAASELALEDVTMTAPARLGVFTRSFIEGLQGRAADLNGTGVITAAKLLAYVRQRAESYCSTNACRTALTPTLDAPEHKLVRDLLTWRREPSTAEPPIAAARPRIDPNDIVVASRPTGVRLHILPSSNVRVGQAIRLQVTSPERGYLILLDVRATGEVVQLFPSRCARKERLLRAGAVLMVPDATYGCEFRADKAGNGRILAIVTKDNVPLDALLSRHRDLEVVPEGSDYLAAIAQQLFRVWAGDERNRAANWGMASAEYLVLE